MFERKKKKLEGLNYLELTPYHLYEGETEQSGFVSVLIPRFTNKALVRYLSPRLKNPHVKAKLDEFGSEVWILIDGQKNVEQIAKALKQKFGERVDPVHERLTKFLTQMYNYSFISFKEIK
jgi:hypothetical protein